jgi:hypothetical protein
MPDQDAVGFHAAAFGLVDVHHAYNVGRESVSSVTMKIK